MNTRLITNSLATAVILAASSANGATILDPTLASGPADIIDLTGGESVNQNFGTAQATLEARSDLRVLQDFTGFAAGATGNNVVSFTATTLPDIQFQFSGGFNDTVAGLATSNAIYATSSGSGMAVRNSATGTSTLTINFGTWDGSAFTGNQTVGAAGFTLTNLYTTRSGDVTFRDSSGTALAGASFGYSGQSDQDSSANHRDIYFGWDSTAQSTAQIGSITITFTDSGSPFQTGFDDLAFTTVIPEPSAALLGGLGLLILLRRRR